MRAMIVYGRAPDSNDKQLYAACKKIVGETIPTRIMDCLPILGSRDLAFGTETAKSQLQPMLLRSFGPGSCEQVTKRISMMEHLEFSLITP